MALTVRSANSTRRNTIRANGETMHMTHDDKIIDDVEKRVRATFLDGMAFGKITRADLDTLLNSRLAWKFTAKCFSASTREPIP